MMAEGKSTKKFLLEMIVVFVVVMAGMIAGLTVANKFGLINWVKAKTYDPADLLNVTNLIVGDRLPQFQATDQQDQPVDFESLLAGKKTIFGIVSDGCEACLEFAESFDQQSPLPDERYQLVLLSIDPEYFLEHHQYRAYRITQEFLDTYSIDAFPTLIAVDDKGIIKFISAGYPTVINTTFLRDNI